MFTGSWNIVAVVTVLLFCIPEPGPTPSGNRPPAPLHGWRVVSIFPHDSEAFTQGLLFYNGYLYESTGRRGHSGIRKVQPETGEIIQEVPMDSLYFGEGLAMWDDRLVQLTLSAKKGFVYDLQTLEKIRTFPYEGQGWGLTSNDEHLIMSDGSAELRFLDPETYREIRRITVTENGEPVSKLNELEMINGKIFANVLGRDHIAVINPETGEVTGRLDLRRLVGHAERNGRLNVLNGIAYDSRLDRIYITGKLWPALYVIKITPPEE